MFLRGVWAEGEVNFVGADIGSNFECDGGTFNNPGAVALNANALRVRHSIFLRAKRDSHGGASTPFSPFVALGEVNLVTAEIGRNLDCTGGTFQNPPSSKNPNAIALNANSVKVGGSVFLRNQFKAEGKVVLTAADIGRGMDCTGGAFDNPTVTALDADTARVAGSVLLNDTIDNEGHINRFIPSGSFNLSGADIKAGLEILTTAKDLQLNLTGVTTVNFFDDERSWPAEGNLKLDGFVYGEFFGGTRDAGQRINWIRRQGAANFKMQPYEQLAKVLRKDGDDEGARTVLITMEDDRWWNTKMGLLERLWAPYFGLQSGMVMTPGGHYGGLAFCC